MTNNLKKLKFSKSEKWTDNINVGDQEIVKPGWLSKLTQMLPYKEHVNFCIDPTILDRMGLQQNSIEESGEKIYAFACFLPPGQHNGCILYNTDEKAETQERKSLYSFIL